MQGASPRRATIKHACQWTIAADVYLSHQACIGSVAQPIPVDGDLGSGRDSALLACPLSMELNCGYDRSRTTCQDATSSAKHATG